MVIKYMTKKDLRRLNQEAQQARGRALSAAALEALPNTSFPVANHQLLDDGQGIRCRIILSPEGLTGTLDVSLEGFQALPTFEM